MSQEPPSPRELIGVGSGIAGLVVTGLLLGWLLDTRIGTLPVFIFVGLAVGMATACYYAYVKFRSFMKND
jgi:F0F1-type ATP synthase assembly protein I